MTCPYCGETHSGNVRFCPNTAARLPKDHQKEEADSTNSAIVESTGRETPERHEPLPFEPCDLLINTEWGARVELFEGDRLKVGRSKSSPWAAHLNSHVSNQHAEIVIESGDMKIIDLASTNGTYVNDVKIIQHTPFTVAAGDVIKFGWVFPCTVRIEASRR
jgi:hypothetical protein